MTIEYHEPAKELPKATRTIARAFAFLIEEAEAIDAYTQRLALEDNADAVRLLDHARREECEHFSMALEFLMRQLPDLAHAGEAILFKAGPIGNEPPEPAENAAAASGDKRFRPLGF